MGGFFAAVSDRDVAADIFFGTDYHSHLGTKSGGMALMSTDGVINRQIHSIETTPFRTRFEADLADMKGTCGIGCISDTDPQPLLVRSKLGLYIIAVTGVVTNAEQLIEEAFKEHGQQFMAMGSGKVNTTELVAALINEGTSLVDGIRSAQDRIDGSVTILLMTGANELIVARDKVGRLPAIIGKAKDGYCVSFESFAGEKLGYEVCYELGPQEIVAVHKDGFEILSPATDNLKICAFLWSYYGYPNSNYEGINVETMRYRNGEIMARDFKERGVAPDVDFVAGIPDSGLPHAIGYANKSGAKFARPFIKYTPTWPRSFMPENQKERNKVAHMKQVPIPELIKGKRLLFLDDSIVRGTQLRETVEFLYASGAAEVHMMSACPPIMYTCKYLNFSRGESDMDLITRRTIQKIEGDEGQKHLDEYSDATTERGNCMLKTICDELGFDSLNYQSLEGLIEAIGLKPEQICTYCWTGKE